MIGVQSADCRKVAELIGIKTFLSEFIAYSDLRKLITNRENLESHVAQNGTWHWSGDDVIMTYPGRSDMLLEKGVISVYTISCRRFDTTLYLDSHVTLFISPFINFATPNVCY